MTILYEPHRREAQRFAVLLGGEAHSATNGPDVGRLLDANPYEECLVLGPGVDLGDALAMATELRVSKPSLAVVLIRETADMALLSEAVRSGIREVVPAADPDALIRAVVRFKDVTRQLAPVSAEPVAPVGGKIITVFAAKGGCGKTTLATNLGVALAAGGQRRVLLIDLDLAFGDVAIMMQLVPERTIVDATSEPHLDELTLRTIVTPYGPGLDTLLAPTGPAEAEKINQGLVAQLLGLARTMFDFIIVDTAPQFTDHILTALDMSHVHVLLTTPDIPALKNLRITLDTFDQLELPRETRLVVLNRSDAKVGLTGADIERVIRFPIAAHVPSSRDVPVSINRGVPIMIDNPQHPVSRVIREFALGRLGAPAAPKNPVRRLRTMLGRGR